MNLVTALMTLSQPTIIECFFFSFDKMNKCIILCFINNIQMLWITQKCKETVVTIANRIWDNECLLLANIELILPRIDKHLIPPIYPTESVNNSLVKLQNSHALLCSIHNYYWISSKNVAVVCLFFALFFLVLVTSLLSSQKR